MQVLAFLVSKVLCSTHNFVL